MAIRLAMHSTLQEARLEPPVEVDKKASQSLAATSDHAWRPRCATLPQVNPEGDEELGMVRVETAQSSSTQIRSATSC